MLASVERQNEIDIYDGLDVKAIQVSNYYIYILRYYLLNIVWAYIVCMSCIYTASKSRVNWYEASYQAAQKPQVTFFLPQ